MARQVYRCPKHGEFTIKLHYRNPVPLELACYTEVGTDRDGCPTFCEQPSPWVPNLPAFIGGPTTGAQKK